MKNLSKFVCILIILMFLGCITLVDCSFDKNIQSENETKKRIDDYIQLVMEKFGVPGIAVGITKEGEVFHIDAFGVKNVITKEKLRPEHLFHMASVSKPFVVTAIVQLVEEGIINLDVFRFREIWTDEGIS